MASIDLDFRITFPSVFLVSIDDDGISVEEIPNSSGYVRLIVGFNNKDPDTVVATRIEPLDDGGCEYCLTRSCGPKGHPSKKWREPVIPSDLKGQESIHRAF